MTAGMGAQEQARRAAQRVEQKRKELAQAEQQAHAWAAGAEGERMVAGELSALAAHGYLAIHDVHWPGRPKANLDHVVVGPGGVFVIDAKNWAGNVQVRAGVLRANGYAKSRECQAAASSVAAVAALLEPQHRTVVFGALCMVQQPLPPTPADGVTILGRSHILAWCLSHRAVLEAAEVQAIHRYLTLALGGHRSPAQLTTAHVLPLAGRVHEPSALARRATTVANRTSAARAPRPPRRPKGGQKAAGRGVFGQLLKFALVLFLALVILPSFVNSLAESVGDTTVSVPPTVSTPMAPATVPPQAGVSPP